uniref:NADH-ubiquinone oxidoreductase chain 5 n=1 Tax=Neogoniolithon spectabile TaxID=231755 RepID=A0A3G3MIL6_9FLOR|nr:NADH dehydrogenase subunit 5 [Neogoniolithon spectabile]AYR06664.1 NADH dehydrogenase subunit 5 [Neogoniolithon spectabile]
MYLLIVFLPLIGSLSCGLFGRFLGQYGSSILSTLIVFISFILSTLAFFEIGLSNTICLLPLSDWISSGVLKINWGFLFDSLTCVMLIVVTTISTLVHMYSSKYMESDPHVPRFMSYLQIFTFFMLVLITSDNLIQLFLGWEGVGLSSYLLINFWHTRYWANQSALKALLVNRVGDFMISLGILGTFYVFRSLDFHTIFSLVPLMDFHYFNICTYKVHSLTLISLLLFLGAVGKSAQLGLHTWLPDAMEGPTPVSALIHAATMVTAGVFLLIRFSPLIEYTPPVLKLMLIFGALTAFFGSVVGVFQNDLKKIIAYSTCSQLGYMVFCCGLSNYSVGIFHLSNHAFFKALLFLCAGSIIHALNDEQDLRRMGALLKLMPLTYSMMLIGSLALAGFPFLTGFYSKDLIIELAQIVRYNENSTDIYFMAAWLGTLSVFFTAFYSFRLLYLTFLNSTESPRIIFFKVHESHWFMTIPLMILGIGSLFVGYLTKDLFVGLGTSFWGNSIYTNPLHSSFLEAEYISIHLKWLPAFFSLLGALLASYLNITLNSFYVYGSFFPNFRYLLFLLNKKWYWDYLFNKVLVRSILNFGYLVSFKTFDRGFIELVGPYGVSRNIKKNRPKSSSLQSGQITHYLFFMLVGILSISTFLLWSFNYFNVKLIISFFNFIHINLNKSL